MTCQAKHTKYQPTDEEFRCPQCGKSHQEGGLSIDEAQEGATDDCELLHPHDYLRCYNPECGYDLTGQAFSNLLIKKKNLVPCRHCKGKGMVPKGKH